MHKLDQVQVNEYNSTHTYCMHVTWSVKGELMSYSNCQVWLIKLSNFRIKLRIQISGWHVTLQVAANEKVKRLFFADQVTYQVICHVAKKASWPRRKTQAIFSTGLLSPDRTTVRYFFSEITANTDLSSYTAAYLFFLFIWKFGHKAIKNVDHRLFS